MAIKRKLYSTALLAGFLVSSILCLSSETNPSKDQLFDLVIKGGRVIDPETKTDRNEVNIGIEGGTIKVITSKKISGKQEIDATGLVVSPGFIDILSFNPTFVGVQNKLADGVTTNLAMHG